MGKLIAVVGPSGVGKTSLVHALNADGMYATALEQHAERPFQALFKQEPGYAFANQIDYLHYRASQELALRSGPQPGLIDGGLDLDFHGFTRLFHARGWLTDPEFDLCARVYDLTRELLPLPELIVRLTAAPGVIRARLEARERLNIATAEDAEMLDQFIQEWLAAVPPAQKLELDVTDEEPTYARSVAAIRARC